MQKTKRFLTKINRFGLSFCHKAVDLSLQFIISQDG